MPLDADFDRPWRTATLTQANQLWARLDRSEALAECSTSRSLHRKRRCSGSAENRGKPSYLEHPRDGGWSKDSAAAGQRPQR